MKPTRPLAWLTVVFSVTLVATLFLDRQAPALWRGLVLSAGAVTLAGGRALWKKSGFPNPFPILLALAILTGYLEGVRALSPIDPESLPDGGQVEMEGVVLSAQPASSGKMKLTLAPAYVVLRESQEKRRTKSKIIAWVSDNAEITSGTRVALRGTLYEIQLPGTPGEFNAYLYYKTRGIAYTCQAAVTRYQETDKLTLRGCMDRLRERLARRINGLLPEKEAGIVNAMIFGEESHMDPEVKRLYQNVGIAHILAISGLHVHILYYALYAILSKGVSKRTATGLCLSILWGYCIFTGAAISTLRAVLMITVDISASILFRPKDPINALCLAALLILLYQPLYILDPGFQLSFSAVAGLMATPALFDRLYWVPKRIRKGIQGSFGVTLATAPVTLYHFYKLSPYSALANLFVVPTMNLVVIGSIAGCLVSGISEFAAEVLLGSVYWILRSYEWLCQCILKLPFSVWRPGRPAMGKLLIYSCILAAGVVYYTKRPSTRQRYRCAMAATVTSGILFLSLWRNNATVAAFLDVGQGDCFILQQGDSVYVEDGGPNYDSVLKPYLQFRGIRTSEGMFLSHPDFDHLESLLALARDPDFSVNALYLADVAVQDTEARKELEMAVAAQDGRIQRISAGDQLNAGSLTVDCLWPTAEVGGTDINGSSLVLRLQFHRWSLLLTGDMDLAAEEAVVDGLSPCTVLKIAHHGSRTASGYEFLKTTAPSLAVISCERGNRYGHPHAEVLQRLDALEIPWRVTEDTGSILITLKKGCVQYREYRKDLECIWRE